MESLQEKLQSLNREISLRIHDLIDEKGTESEHVIGPTLKIPERFQYNTEDGRGGFFIEINANILIDNNGHHYAHDHLTTMQLCEIVDSISGYNID